MRLRNAGIALVLLHLLVTIPHSIAHTNLGIDMSQWQNVYIYLVILLAPIVAGVLLWRRSRSGFLVLVVSMAGSFLFGVLYHFVLSGADNAMTLHPHPWTMTFQVSAVLLALVELAGAVTGFIGTKQMSDTL